MTDEDSRARQSLEKQEDNGPEKWHDALTRYTELEKRVAALEEGLQHLDQTIVRVLRTYYKPDGV